MKKPNERKKNDADICLFWFSGTGMTRRVVEKFAEACRERGASVCLAPMEQAGAVCQGEKPARKIGLACPVHAFNAPKRVVQFARALPPGQGKPLFLLQTAGEEAPVNHAACLLLRRLLTAKGYRVFYERQFAMPSNFAWKHGDEKVARQLAAADGEAVLAAREVLCGRVRWLKSGPVTRLLAAAGRAEWVGAPLIGRRFSANGACNGCGKCVEICPNENICIKDGKAAFGTGCGLCMRCLYSCPKDAIRVGKPFGFIKLKEWYKL